jgi:nucleoid-associated protein EbfC
MEDECMRGNMGNLMKQAQAIKENVEKAQAEVASIEVVGESGGGMVKVTMSGRHEVKKVQIEPAVAADDRELLEDLVAAAVNDAVHRVEARIQEKMAGAMAGMQLPPGMKLPF